MKLITLDEVYDIWYNWNHAHVYRTYDTHHSQFIEPIDNGCKIFFGISIQEMKNNFYLFCDYVKLKDYKII